MLGFSFAELIVVIIVVIIFIKPDDMPEIARFIGKLIYHGKHNINKIKNHLKEIEKEIGIDKLKEEFNQSIAEEKAKLENDITIIVDMYGNEHEVSNIYEIRDDIRKEDLEQEIIDHNNKNLQSKKNVNTLSDKSISDLQKFQD